MNGIMEDRSSVSSTDMLVRRPTVFLRASLVQHWTTPRQISLIATAAVCLRCTSCVTGCRGPAGPPQRRPLLPHSAERRLPGVSLTLQAFHEAPCRRTPRPKVSRPQCHPPTHAPLSTPTTVSAPSSPPQVKAASSILLWLPSSSSLVTVTQDLASSFSCSE